MKKLILYFSFIFMIFTHLFAYKIIDIKFPYIFILRIENITNHVLITNTPRLFVCEQSGIEYALYTENGSMVAVYSNYVLYRMYIINKNPFWYQGYRIIK